MTNKGKDKEMGTKMVVPSKNMQHYNRTTHRELDMSYDISQMVESLPNILAITGGVSARQKEGNGNTQSMSGEDPWHIFPTTVTQTQC